jgi:hypothetical protein
LSPHIGAAASPVTGNPGTLKREVILSAAADEVLSSLIQAFRSTTHTRLSASHVVRAMLMGAGHALPELEREIQRLGPMKLPSNGLGFHRKREQFEGRLAAAFVAGMRAAAVLNTGE